ncbi:hypothetical protein [Mucilaginibacter sp.]|uniref:hypothetical protein n=1 Tax=Mucilaginibacter sp. TaxID=1882438 RepID=UPI00283AC148|nr:hypothetical protein [Mucilaginibacter sp.]MDR3695121.1 hypothetical protein [Mucilaginibacter sp.]
MVQRGGKRFTTANQQRFYELRLKQKNGKASLKELTELDDLVNNDPLIRESILRQIGGNNEEKE